MRAERSSIPSLGPRGEGWVVLQAVAVAAMVAAGEVGRRWPDRARVPTLVAGVPAGLLGAWLLASGVRTLGPSLTPLPRPLEQGELKRGGAYARVRHPIYGGLLCLAIAWALLRGPLALVPAGALGVVFELKARLEEHWLRLRYEGYADYARAVPRRFVPFMW